MIANKIFAISICILIALSSCSKKGTLPELEYNKWIEEIEDPITIDEIETSVVNPTEAKFTIRFSFDRVAFEEKWTKVESIQMSINRLGSGNRPSGSLIVSLDADGNGVAEPNYAYTSSTYEIGYFLVLENGRTSPEVTGLIINTPEY